MAESVKMIKSLAEQGITDIFSTPDVTVSMDIGILGMKWKQH